MDQEGKKGQQGKTKRPVATEKGRKSRIHITEKPFTLHIDDTPENVARALLGKPLNQD